MDPSAAARIITEVRTMRPPLTVENAKHLILVEARSRGAEVDRWGAIRFRPYIGAKSGRSIADRLVFRRSVYELQTNSGNGYFKVASGNLIDRGLSIINAAIAVAGDSELAARWSGLKEKRVGKRESAAEKRRLAELLKEARILAMAEIERDPKRRSLLHMIFRREAGPAVVSAMQKDIEETALVLRDAFLEGQKPKFPFDIDTPTLVPMYAGRQVRIVAVTEIEGQEVEFAMAPASSELVNGTMRLFAQYDQGIVGGIIADVLARHPEQTSHASLIRIAGADPEFGLRIWCRLMKAYAVKNFEAASYAPIAYLRDRAAEGKLKIVYDWVDQDRMVLSCP